MSCTGDRTGIISTLNRRQGPDAPLNPEQGHGTHSEAWNFPLNRARNPDMQIFEFLPAKSDRVAVTILRFSR